LGNIVEDLRISMKILLIKIEQERQGNKIDGLMNESDKLNSLLNPHNCSEAKLNGIYDTVIPSFSSQPFKVACDAITRDGGWTIILRRIDGSVNFYRNWDAYKNGFGDLNGEFFMGSESADVLKLFKLSAARRISMASASLQSAEIIL